MEIPASRIEAAKLSRGLTATLGGTCVAIFTFLLFFLYPRFALGEVDPNLFRLTMLAILVSLNLLLFASWFYFLFTQVLGQDSQRPGKYLRWADGCFAIAVIVLAIAPSLVLFTVSLPELGFVALGLWGAYLIVFSLGVLDVARGRRGRANAR